MNKKALLLLPAFVLAGCGDDTIECSSDISTQTLVELLQKFALEQTAPESVAPSSVTNAMKRSSLEKVIFTVSNIITTSKDPNSTLRTCSATVSLKIDANEYNDLSDFYSKNYQRNFDKTMESYNLEQNANTFSTKIDYTVQPTDDKKTVFVKSVANNGASAGAAFISTLSIMQPIVEQEKVQRAKQQQALAEQQAEQAAKKEQLKQQTQTQVQNVQSETPATPQSQPVAQTAAPSQQELTVNEARERFMEADRNLSTTWHELGQSRQKALLPEQRQWIRNKESICGKISLKGSDTDIIRMFQCQYDMTQQRVSQLVAAK
ncbi:lysozyme inhibitor LprI family protein [Kluyvera sichuanensis]|uniref:DUF1311 domain-containing protein n=1 Tax=Kluyvera sichuanensis TaxID=2725494 RepID=A0ABR6RQV4_9ENTR|nr:hypothetical protein [Kluyvera sichuanensis]MBC1185506.1 hypothetical protein [Kluyvera sichuanensis]